MKFIAASHNIMDGRLWKELLRHYSALDKTLTKPLGLLNIQENVTIPQIKNVHNSTTCANLIANALGSEFKVLANEVKDPRLAIIYNSNLFTLVGKPSVLRLPRLERLPMWNKLFIKSGKVEQKNALVCDFQRRKVMDAGSEINSSISSSLSTKLTPSPPSILRCINFHLDAAGDNEHRKRQMAGITSAMVPHDQASNDSSRQINYIISGDTNIFHFSNKLQLQHLKSAVDCLSPIISMNDNDRQVFDRPTHWFARANEPTMVHQAGVFLGKYFGIDKPQCYDVVLTNLNVVCRGQISTPDCSDHDLVYACIEDCI